jgi:hypothetical protein
MVDNPNVFLDAALAGKVINSHTVLHVSTSSNAGTVPNAGGGVADIAFLDGAGGGPNAEVALTESTFWISHFTDALGSGTLLQYSQVVLLNFAPLSWPHVSVASLIKRRFKAPFKDKLEIKEVIDVPPIRPEFKDLEGRPPVGPGPGPDPALLRAGPAAAAPAEGRHFITADERPLVGDASLKEAPPKPTRRRGSPRQTS